MPLFLAFIDLTKTFDPVNRDSFSTDIAKIGSPPRLLRVIHSSHDNIKGAIQYDASKKDAFDIRSVVKQSCIPTLFDILFAVLLQHAFGTPTVNVSLLGQTAVYSTWLYSRQRAKYRR